MKKSLEQLFPDGQPVGSWLNIQCPFCKDGDPNGKHLGLNQSENRVNCFRCGYSDRLHWFIKTNRPKDELAFSLDEKKDVETKPAMELPAEFFPLWQIVPNTYYWIRGVPHSVNSFLDYINCRIGLPMGKRLKLGACFEGKYHSRVIVPSYSKSEQLEYFIARSVFDRIKPKVLNPLGNKTTIWNFEKACEFNEIYLTEGIFGAITLWPYGAALYGKNCNDAQLWQIVKSDLKVLNIYLDGNAIKEAYKLADRILNLTKRIKIRIIKIDEDLQPDNLSFEQSTRLRRAEPFYQGQ